MTPRNANDEAEQDLIDEAIRARIQQASPRHGGRRESDGWMISPKMLGGVTAVITIILALFSPVFYVRDMAGSVRDVTRAVDEMKQRQDSDRQNQATDHAAIIVLQAQAAQSAAQRADHEQRLRAVELNK